MLFLNGWEILKKKNKEIIANLNIIIKQELIYYILNLLFFYFFSFRFPSHLSTLSILFIFLQEIE